MGKNSLKVFLTNATEDSKTTLIDILKEKGYTVGVDTNDEGTEYISVETSSGTNLSSGTVFRTEIEEGYEDSVAVYISNVLASM